MVHVDKDMLAGWLVRRADAINRANVVTALDLIHRTARFLRGIQAWQFDIRIRKDVDGIICAVELDGERHAVPVGKAVA